MVPLISAANLFSIWAILRLRGLQNPRNSHLCIPLTSLPGETTPFPASAPIRSLDFAAMSGQGGVSISRSRNGHRFYDPPAVRRQQQQQQQQQQKQQQTVPRQQVQKPLKHKVAAEPESRGEPDDCSSTCSVSHQALSDSSNLDRFLKYTTPVVPAQHFPKVVESGS